MEEINPIRLAPTLAQITGVGGPLYIRNGNSHLRHW